MFYRNSTSRLQYTCDLFSTKLNHVILFGFCLKQYTEQRAGLGPAAQPAAADRRSFI